MRDKSTYRAERKRAARAARVAWPQIPARKVVLRPVEAGRSGKSLPLKAAAGGLVLKPGNQPGKFIVTERL